MQHVIDTDAAGEESALLTGSGGLLGGQFLADRPLADYLEEYETPRYLLRNRKRGVQVEDVGGAGSDRDEAESITPDGDYSGLALITDVRVLFAVGRDAGDWSASLPLADLVDASVEDGILGATLVVATIDDERYRFRFSCRGDPEQAASFLERGIDVWTRAEARLDRAERAADGAESALDAGDVSAALDRAADGRDALSEAEAEAAALDGVGRATRERRDESGRALAQVERRSFAERAARARERALARWDDSEYGAAHDALDDAVTAVNRALSIDAAAPPDEALERRRDRLEEERAELRRAPLSRAEAAAERARAADDPSTAIERWETAHTRYWTLFTLDWGRDEPRFECDREAVRDRLAAAAREIVAAHCDLARERAADAEAASPDDRESARDALDGASDAVDDAARIADAYVPGARERVRAVRERISRRRGELLGEQVERERGPESSPDDGAAEVPLTEMPTRIVADRSPGEASGGRPGDVTEPDGEPGTVTESNGGPGGAPQSDDGPGSGGSAGSGVVGAASPAGAPGENRDGSPDTADARPAQTAPPTARQEAENAGDSAEGESRVTPDALAATPADAFPDVVGELFESHGWSTTLFGESTARKYDVLAVSDGPVDVSVAVWTAHPDEVEAVDAATVERVAAFVGRTDAADAAVVASASPFSDAAREQAARHGVTLLDADDIAAALDGTGADFGGLHVSQ